MKTRFRLHAGILPHVAMIGMLVLSQVGHAAQARLPLSSALERAVLQHPTLSSAALRLDILEAEQATAGLKPAWQLEVEADRVLGTGELSGVEGAELSIGLSSLIERGNKRQARLATGNARQQEAQVRQRILELDLLAETTRRYLAVAAAEEELSLRSRATALVQETVTTLQRQVQAGRLPEAELARASAALARAELAETSADSELTASRVALSSLWGELSPDFDGVRMNLLEELQSTETGFEQLLQTLENTPDLALFAREQAVREAELAQARTALTPDLRWSGGLVHDRGNRDTAFRLSFSLPLASAERGQGAVAAGELAARQPALEREAALNQLQGKLYSQYQQREQALLEIRTLQQDVLPLLRQALGQTREAFLAGRYSYLDWVSARQELLDAEFTLIDAALKAHLLRIDIERLSGVAWPAGGAQ